MKYIIQILLLLNALQLSAQSGCNSYGIVVSTEKSNTNDSLSNEEPLRVTLFSQIDFDNAKSISILYESDKDHTLRACYLDDINIIEGLSQEYTDSEIIKTPFYFGQSDRRDLVVIENNISIHQYQYDNKNNLLFTEYGAIKFENEQIANSCKIVEVKTHNEHHYGELEAAIRMKELQELGDLIYHDKVSEFVSGVIQFEFIDLQDKVNQILRDSFWLKMVQEELADNYENPSRIKGSSEDLMQTGRIIQRLIKLEIKQNDFKVLKWDKSDKQNTYTVTLNYSDEELITELSDFIILSNLKKYEFNYITKEEIR